MEFFKDLNMVTTVLRIAMAIACGGVLGLERKKAQQAAGMRTYMLICMGSAIVSMISQYMYNYVSESHPDAERLGAQVISGAAVLAALVVAKGGAIKGLTTAAEMWTSACIGLAIGIGFYWGGIIGTVAIYVIMTVFHRIETNAVLKSAPVGLHISARNRHSIIAAAQVLGDMGIEIFDISIERDMGDLLDLTSDSSTMEMCLGTIKLRTKDYKQDEIITKVLSVDGVKSARYQG